MDISSVTDPDGQTAVYAVAGELFFASASDLADHFDYAADPQHVTIDLADAHIWDASAVAALDRVITKYAQHGKTAELTGMNQTSSILHRRLAGQLHSGH